MMSSTLVCPVILFDLGLPVVLDTSMKKNGWKPILIEMNMSWMEIFYLVKDFWWVSTIKKSSSIVKGKNVSLVEKEVIVVPVLMLNRFSIMNWMLAIVFVANLISR